MPNPLFWPQPQSFYGQERQKIRYWWNGQFAALATGLYNDGRHLYVWPKHLTPGTFVSPPTVLKHFSYRAAVSGVKFKDLTIFHAGHASQSMYGSEALVCVARGRRCTTVIIPQYCIVFFLQTARDYATGLTFCHNIQWVRLSPRVLEVVPSPFTPYRILRQVLINQG